MRDCYFTGNITAVNTVGGLVGNLQKTGVVDGCYTTCNITSSGNNIGGLFGVVAANGTITIKNSYHITGTLESTVKTGDVFIGGIAGVSAATEIENCYAECVISTSRIYAAGIVAYQKAVAKISKCHFKGEISAYRHVGGIIGRTTADIDISDCWSSGKLTNQDAWIGGIMAYSAYPVKISNSYSNAKLQEVLMLED